MKGIPFLKVDIMLLIASKGHTYITLKDGVDSWASVPPVDCYNPLDKPCFDFWAISYHLIAFIFK